MRKSHPGQKDRLSGKCPGQLRNPPSENKQGVKTMKGLKFKVLGLSLLVLLAPSALFSQFNRQDWRVSQIASDLTVGYAVHICDLNGDGKADVLILDSRRIVAFYGPDFKPTEIARDFAKPDLVCITSLDIDGDGRLDLVVGADWKPFNTKSGGTIQWLRQPGKEGEKWTVTPITEEPTIHRIKTADLDGDGKPEVIAVALMGYEASAKANWMDGRPVRVLSLKPGANPKSDPWLVQSLDQSLHVVHNFLPIKEPGKDPFVITASYEGLGRLVLNKKGLEGKVVPLHAGNQEKPSSNRGASEVARGKNTSGNEMFATVEPWHGNQIVAYEQNPNKLWTRTVLDEQLKWGHAVSIADLDNDGVDEVIAGIRDNLSENPGKRRGVRIYRRNKVDPSQWMVFVLEDGGVAVEDLVIGDLDGDGLKDIVVSGRATQNARIYFQNPQKPNRLK